MTKHRLTDQQARRVAAQRTHSGIDPNDAGEAGVVIASYGKQVLVEHDDQQRTLCHLRAHLTPPVAGDQVIWAPSEETGVISAPDRASQCARETRYSRSTQTDCRQH